MFGKHTTRGFTLIEILVVIVIVGTIVSIVVLSTGIIPEDEELRTERTRLTALLETVQDEAMMQGREFGLEIMTSAYRFVEFDALTRQWMEVPFDELYRLRDLPDGVEFELYIDDKRVQLSDEPQAVTDIENTDASTGDEAAYVPHLYIFGSGEASAFELRIIRPLSRNEVVMRGDILGEVTFGEDDEI